MWFDLQRSCKLHAILIVGLSQIRKDQHVPKLSKLFIPGSYPKLPLFFFNYKKYIYIYIFIYLSFSGCRSKASFSTFLHVDWVIRDGHVFSRMLWTRRFAVHMAFGIELIDSQIVILNSAQHGVFPNMNQPNPGIPQRSRTGQKLRGKKVSMLSVQRLSCYRSSLARLASSSLGHSPGQLMMEADENMLHADILLEVAEFYRSTVPHMNPSEEPLPVPVWALHTISVREAWDNWMFDHLQDLWRNPAAVEYIDPLNVILHSGRDGRSILMCSNKADQKQLDVLHCLQAVHLNQMLQVRCQVRVAEERDRETIASCLKLSLLGEWEDDDDSRVTVAGSVEGQVVAHIKKEGRPARKVPLRVDQNYRVICGQGVLQEITPEEVVWLSDCMTKCWAWRRPNEHIPHSPSDEPVCVPVWALRFTQYNINGSLRFTDNSRMIDMFKDLMFRPRRVQHLEPLEVFLYHGPDGKIGLYSANNRRLMVLRCLQGLYADILWVRCYIFDARSREISPDGRTRICHWFNQRYSRPNQFPGCDGCGLSDLGSPMTATEGASRLASSLEEKGTGQTGILQGLKGFYIVIRGRKPWLPRSQRDKGASQPVLTFWGGMKSWSNFSAVCFLFIWSFCAVWWWWTFCRSYGFVSCCCFNRFILRIRASPFWEFIRQRANALGRLANEKWEKKDQKRSISQENDDQIFPKSRILYYIFTWF